MAELDAYGALGLKPWEFMRLTVYDFERMLKAWEAEQDRRRRQSAWVVANLMNASGNMKEAVTVESLLAGKNGQRLDLEKLRLRAEENRKLRLLEREQRNGGKPR